jgi:hypothetical protein
VDWKAIQDAGLKVVVDAMYGAGAGTGVFMKMALANGAVAHDPARQNT